MQAVILCGGKGTRTCQTQRPKCLLTVWGRPFLYHQLHWLAAAGVVEVLLCVGHQADQVREYVGDGQRWRLVVDYSEDGDGMIGTTAALLTAHARGWLRDWFMVLNGDTWLTIDLRDVVERFLRHRSSAAVLRWNGVDAGLYLLQRSAVWRLTGPNLSIALQRERPLEIPATAPFYDIGTPAGLAQLEALSCT